MLKYITGNVLDSGLPVVHCVNAQHRMASGVAKAIRQKYPQVYEDYMNTKVLNLGDVIVTKENTNIVVFSIVGQKYYGYDSKRYVDYNALQDGLLEVSKLCEQNNIDAISMPLIGAGLAGGDWEDIEPIIKRIFKYISVYIYIYVLPEA